MISTAWLAIALHSMPYTCLYRDMKHHALLCSRLSSEHAHNTRACTNLQNNFALEKITVSQNCIAIGQGSHLILQHLLHDNRLFYAVTYLVNSKVCVGIKVVVLATP